MAAYSPEDVDSVIDANANAERHHGQGGYLEPDPDQGHERIGKHRHGGKRQDDAENGTERTESEQNQQDDCCIDISDDRELRRIDLLVGRGHHADIAGSKPERDRAVRVGGIEGLHRVHDPLDRFRPVVLGIHVYWHDTAVGVEEAAGSRDRGDRLNETVAVAWQGLPLEIALVPGRVQPPRGARKPGNRHDALDIAHGPLEVVERPHCLEVDAALG